MFRYSTTCCAITTPSGTGERRIETLASKVSYRLLIGPTRMQTEADLKRAKPHHIVPLTYQDARKCESDGKNVCDEARRILARAGLDLNNPANGVLLPDRRGQLTTFDAAYPNATEHCCLHTSEYFERVFRELKDVENRFSSNPALFAQKVRETLEQMADELLAGSFR